MQRAVITVVGRDAVGIIASVCAKLADDNINILDITQSIVKGYFNMMMIVDVTELSKPFSAVTQELEDLGGEIGVQIRCQKEEIFDSMHRI
jgi:ACT domain-containing protein